MGHHKDFKVVLGIVAIVLSILCHVGKCHGGWWLILCVPAAVLGGLAGLVCLIMFSMYMWFVFLTAGWKLTHWKCFDPGAGKTWL